MVSPVHHPVTPNQADNVTAEVQQKQVQQKQTPQTAQKESTKPQPVQDTVKLSRTSNPDHNRNSK